MDLQPTIDFVKSSFEGAEGGHDWFHTERVWKMARHIRDREGEGDLLTVELASLLHDIADPKFNGGDEEAGERVAGEFLHQQGLDPHRRQHVVSIIRNISFKGGHSRNAFYSTEFGIVQDADRLDAIGAIGIARAFNYGGYKNLPIYDPGVPLREYADSGAYYSSKAPTVNHFYEKLLKLKDLMNTSTGRALAEERHRFMLLFLEQFGREVRPDPSE